MTIRLSGLTNPRAAGTFIEEIARFATTYDATGGIIERSKLPASTLTIEGMDAQLDLADVAVAGAVGNLSVAFDMQSALPPNATIEFKLPKTARAGQILHVFVPGQHDLQPVRVPRGAKSGMMLWSGQRRSGTRC